MPLPWFHSRVHETISFEAKRIARNKDIIEESQRKLTRTPRNIMEDAARILIETRIAKNFSLLAKEDLIRSSRQRRVGVSPALKRLFSGDFYETMSHEYRKFRGSRLNETGLKAAFEKNARACSKTLTPQEIDAAFGHYSEFMRRIYEYRDKLVRSQ